MDEKRNTSLGFLPEMRALPEMISFALGENGCMEETHTSIVSRINDKWGFDPMVVKLMESDSCAPFELGGKTYYACASVRFTVRGVGWATDFVTIERAPEWDDEKEKEE